MKSPGSREVAYTGTGIQAPNGGGKWGAAVFDPAHTRAIGCVGIPDTNQNPTTIPAGRKEITISAVHMTRPHYVITQSYIGAPFHFASTAYGNEWTFYQHPKVGFMAFNPKASFVYKNRESDANATTVTNQPAWFVWNVLVPNDDPVDTRQINAYDERTISAGFTVRLVTKWSDMGGYFTGGHVALETSDDMVEDVTDGIVLPDVESLSNWVTYQAGSAEGAYAVCRPRHMPSLLEFQSQKHQTFYAPMGGFTATGKMPLQGSNQSWDAVFVRYFGTADDYQLAITAYHNKERLTPYQDGGTDGAVYDKVALEAVPAACDKMICIYPASYNDLGKLTPYLFKAFKHLGRAVRNTLGIDAAVLDGPTFRRRFFREIVNELGQLTN